MLFATPYTIHFDDTMAYGSHHFLTSFKLQCAAREALLFGEHVFDVAGVREALDQIHLFTADAYARNLNPARLGDRLVVFVTFEERGQVGGRYCFRVLDSEGRPICAGFQTVVCAGAQTGLPMPVPPALAACMDALARAGLDEPLAEQSFRDRVLAGGSKTEALFDASVRDAARRYLATRHPIPMLFEGGVSVVRVASAPASEPLPVVDEPPAPPAVEAWVFSGQGSFDAALLSTRIAACPELRVTLDACGEIARSYCGGDGAGLVSGAAERCGEAIRATPALDQIGIFLQNVLGAHLRARAGLEPEVLVGHSFGELAAMCVAGCYALPVGVQIVGERMRAIERHAAPGRGLLAASIDRASLESEIAGFGIEDVVIAGRNHGRQTVASGPKPALERLRQRLQDLRIGAVVVASPTSFHHPALANAASAFLAALRGLAIEGPRRRLYSPIGRIWITASDDVAAVLASQLLRPFDLEGALADLADVGITRAIDCGSSGVFERLLRAASDRLEVIRETAPAAPRAPVAEALVPEAPVPRVSAPRAPEPRAPEPRAPASEVSAAHEPSNPAIAILGEGCLLPGGARDPDRLWQALALGREGVVDLRTRDPLWTEDFYSASNTPDRSTSALAGVVNDDDIAVPPGIDPRVFASWSRTQRLLAGALAQCRPALSPAGRRLCLVGATADGFEDQDAVVSLVAAGLDPDDPEVVHRLGLPRHARLSPHRAVAEVVEAVIGAGVRTILIDAACASSLYTTALGMRALEQGEADLVIAGGVFCPGPGNNCLFSQFGGLTASACRPFDAHADGVAFSEGAAFVVLARTSDAERSGWPITATVRGAGLSSDGMSPSANVPQTAGQTIALSRCYGGYGIDPASIDAVEGHGTSTPVGDATELKTLRGFFAGHVSAPIPVHSLKGLLGHAGWAAGTASIIAACQSLRRLEVPAQAHHHAPSQALEAATGVLMVPTVPRRLPPGRRRIAVDGFGFGGANAHLVVESYGGPAGPFPVRPSVEARHAELVVVASHGLVPAADGRPVPVPGEAVQAGFDRSAVTLPRGVVLLPDLVEDMDVSQTLAIGLLAETLAQIPGLSPELRRDTAVVLAMTGKTERGVQATLRVLAPRLGRDLVGTAAARQLTAAAAAIRPSGPYTLQCMMPNVSAGRATSRMDLKGPNFVVDDGPRSLAAALESATLMLSAKDGHGVKLVVVQAISANPWRAPSETSSRPRGEIAASFAVTTRERALTLGLPVVCVLRREDGVRADASPESTWHRPGAEGAEALLLAIRKAAAGESQSVSFPGAGVWTASPATPAFPLHEPVWIEAPIERTAASPRCRAALVLAPDRSSTIAEILAAAPLFAEQCLVATVGPSAHHLATALSDPRVMAIDVTDEHTAATGLRRVRDFDPDVVLAIDPAEHWDPVGTLAHVAMRGGVHELLFLIAKQHVDALARVELWGLCPNGWSAHGVAHPRAGALAGLLKSIRRERPEARVGVVSTRTSEIREGLLRIAAERVHGASDEPELAFDDARRWVRRLRPISMTAARGPRLALGPDAVVIASGGARGVTAVLAEALLADFGCTVVALGRGALRAVPAGTDPDDPEVEREFFRRELVERPGRSPAELRRAFERLRADWEAHQTLERLTQAGGRVHYVAVDVTDREAVERVVDDVLSRFGRIDLLLHGAGVQWSKRIERRSLAEFRTTIAVKIRGLHNLVEACRSRLQRVPPVHALTSAYSLFGNDGQPDYGSANEMLDRLCDLADRHEGAPWSSIAWLAWDGIGMTRGSEYRTLAEVRGLSGIDAAHGQRLFRDVMSGRTGAAIHVPLTDAERTRYEVKVIASTAGNDGAGRPRPSGSEVRAVAIGLSELACLSHHIVRGQPTLPGAWALERMVDATLALAAGEAVTIEDVRFSRFVRVVNGREPVLRAIVEPEAHGFRVRMLGDLVHERGIMLARDLSFCEARIVVGREPVNERPRVRELGERRTVEDPYCGARAEGWGIALSGPFDCLRDIEIGPSGRRATFVPPRVDLGKSRIPALLLDAAWRVSAMYAAEDRDELYVPVTAERVVAPIGLGAHDDGASRVAEGWTIRTEAPVVDGEIVRCGRIEVVDVAGTVRMVVDGAVARRLS